MHPFDCAECSQHPAEDFTIYDPGRIDDWLIAYPQQRVIHIHYGTATHQDADNVAETKFVQKFLLDTAAAHPNTKFFLFVDISRADDSEFVPPESLRIYRGILQNPQLNHGVIYGGTPAAQFMMKTLMVFTRLEVGIVNTRTQADTLYQQWLTKNK